MCDFKKILAPKEICKMSGDLINKSLSLLNIDIQRDDMSGCSYKCEWVTVCDVDGNCNREQICWWECSGKKTLLPKDICSDYNKILIKAEELIKTNIDLKGCSYRCEFFTVCDVNGNCKTERICWWQCAN